MEGKARSQAPLRVDIPVHERNLSCQGLAVLHKRRQITHCLFPLSSQLSVQLAIHLAHAGPRAGHHVGQLGRAPLLLKDLIVRTRLVGVNVDNGIDEGDESFGLVGRRLDRFGGG